MTKGKCGTRAPLVRERPSGAKSFIEEFKGMASRSNEELINSHNDFVRQGMIQRIVETRLKGEKLLFSERLFLTLIEEMKRRGIPCATVPIVNRSDDNEH